MYRSLFVLEQKNTTKLFYRHINFHTHQKKEVEAIYFKHIKGNIYIFFKNEITKKNISYRRAAAVICRGNLHRTWNENALLEMEQH